MVTSAHRDAKDLKACLVLVIGTHTGGELCLMEPGIVLPLRSGDLVIFQSPKVTHFNMHYKGVRASLVLHSDREGLKYAMDHNMWNRNNYSG